MLRISSLSIDMGQKVHPFAFRLGNIYTWPSKWFSSKNFRTYLKDDVCIREFLKKKISGAGLTKIEIDRSLSGATVTIFAAKPGLIIGRGGAQIEDLKRELKSRFPSAGTINVNIQEVDRPSLHSAVIAEGIKLDIEKRMPFRRVIKQALDRIQKAGGLGGKVTVAGRLNGAEIAREESVSFGSIPLQNLRADIDFAFTEAQTIYGKIGIKVWVYRGEIFEKEKKI